MAVRPGCLPCHRRNGYKLLSKQVELRFSLCALWCSLRSTRRTLMTIPKILTRSRTGKRCGAPPALMRLAPFLSGSCDSRTAAARSRLVSDFNCLMISHFVTRLRRQLQTDSNDLALK